MIHTVEQIKSILKLNTCYSVSYFVCEDCELSNFHRTNSCIHPLRARSHSGKWVFTIEARYKLLNLISLNLMLEEYYK